MARDIMTRDMVVESLRKNMEKIRNFGVKRIGIFGSFARDQARDDSDIDIVVEFEKGKGTLKNFCGLVDFLEELFGREVDILTPDGIENIRIEYVKEEIKREVVYL